ncbi:MAG: hypothetical protein P9M13_04100 [Candidatus Ancaeobacter aquaticus]|nr:hypothetical protein [Candidatus Ancaeobacter aquaticus]
MDRLPNGSSLWEKTQEDELPDKIKRENIIQARNIENLRILNIIKSTDLLGLY